MVVVHDAAVGADGHIDAGFLIVLVARSRHLDQRGGLAAANALGLAGDADRTAADAHLDKVRTRLGQEQEAVAIHHVACANLDGIAVMLAHPGQRAALPLGKALGGVDAQHVSAGLHKSGHALGVVAGVDARAHHVALLGVEQLVGVLLVLRVVLAEHHIDQMLLLVNQRQGVELVLPDDVVGDL